MHKSVQSEISRLGPANERPPGPTCPPTADWLEVVAGLLPETRTRELMTHAAQCDHCGPLLRSAAETLSSETTQNEDELLASLSTVRPERRRELAKRLTRANLTADAQKKRSMRSSLLSWNFPAWRSA